MTRRPAVVLIGFSLLALGLLSFKLSEVEANRGALRRNQNQDRMVRDLSDKLCPVRIRLIKTKKRTIRSNEEFSDDDDWLQGLSVRVKNYSDKTVTYVGLQLTFRKTDDQPTGLLAVFPLDYGFDPLWLEPGDPVRNPTVKPIPPGEEAEIVLSDALHDELKAFLARTGYFPNHRRLDLDIAVAGFSDETMWNLRKWFQRDPTQLKKPLPGWRLLDDALRERNSTRELMSSASNRTAFFMIAGFRSESPATRFASARWSAPQEGCGDYIHSTAACANRGETGISCRYDDDQ